MTAVKICNVTITNEIICKKIINSNKTKIDNTFIINLNSRTDLWDKILEVNNFLKNKKINVQRIEGFDFCKEIKTDPLLLNKLINDEILSMECSGLRKNITARYFASYKS